MIVYNVDRRWFTMKADAETHRKTLKLKPGATATIEVKGRDDLVALLNALCEPQSEAALQGVAPAEVIDRAWVDPATDMSEIPTFLLKGLASPEAVAELQRREAGKGGIFG